MSTRYYTFQIPGNDPLLIGDSISALVYAWSGRVSGAGGQAASERAPTSDDSVSGDWSGTPGSRYQLVDDYPDPTGIDYLQFGPTAGNICFGFSPLSVPSGATIHAVNILVYVTEVAGGTNRWYGRVKAGGNYYNDTQAHFPTSTQWSYQTARFSNNPKTGLPWTADDVNGVGANALQGFGIYSTDVNPAIRFSSVQLQVVYSVAYAGDPYIDAEHNAGVTAYPNIGDIFFVAATGIGGALIIPWDETRSGYLYPDPYVRINYDSNLVIQAGDIVYDYDGGYIVVHADEVVEAGAGWFKGEANVGNEKLTYAGGQNLYVNRGGQWFYGTTLPRDPLYLPSALQSVSKYNVRIMSLTGELFPVAGYEQPYREKVKMKLLIRGVV
jgi:hypothetical protein